MNHFIEMPLNAPVLEAKKYFLLALALFIVPLSGLGIDIYIPSLPAITQYFGVTKSFAQLSVTAYMAGLGFMQLFAGGISDSYGRRKPFLISMIVFIIATFLVPFSHTITQLLLLRFIQGTMVALVVVPIRSIVSDLFQGSEYLKMTNYMVMAWSIGPIIAPFIGGYLQEFFGWKSNFYFLMGYSILGFLMFYQFMPETSQYRHPFHMGNNIKRFKEMLLHRDYRKGLLLNSLLYSLVLLFAIVGPFLIQNVLHFSAAQFGHIALLTGFAWFMGSMTNRILIHVSVERKTKFGLLVLLLISITTLLINMLCKLNIFNIVIPALLIFWVAGTIFPNYFGKSIAYFPKTTGSANALFGSMIFMIAGLVSAFGTLLKSSTAIPLMASYVIIVLLSMLITRR